MLNPTNVFFSILFALGAYVIVSGLLSPRKKADHGAEAAPLAQRLLEPALLFFHNRFNRERVVGRATEVEREQARREKAGRPQMDEQSYRLTVEDRLLRSGYRYETVGAYYAAKVLGAVGLFVLGAVIGVVLRLPVLATVVLAAGLGVLGLTSPDLDIKKAIEARRKALFREMAWTLDRIAVLLETGLALDNAVKDLLLVSKGRGGLFIALLRDLAGALDTRQTDIEQVLLRIKKSVPELPELNEFLRLLQLNIEQSQAIAPQVRVLADFMRDELTNQIEERRQAAEMRVVFLTSGVIVPALLLIVGGPAFISFLRSII